MGLICGKHDNRMDPNVLRSKNPLTLLLLCGPLFPLSFHSAPR
jgi:hypothetical protein